MLASPNGRERQLLQDFELLITQKSWKVALLASRNNSMFMWKEALSRGDEDGQRFKSVSRVFTAVKEEVLILLLTLICDFLSTGQRLNPGFSASTINP